MQTLLFTLPLKHGTLEKYQQFINEVTGPKKREYSAMLIRYGLKTAKIWHHKIANQDYVFVLHDAEDDALERLKSWSSSTHPFDRWFDEQLFNCYDFPNFDSLPDQPRFLYHFIAAS